jgi:hypothetical protein
MKIPVLFGTREFWNPYLKSLEGNDPIIGTSFSDWQVVVSRDKQILDAKQMRMDMPNTRLKPVYSPDGDLTIIVLAESRKAAESRGHHIALRIAEAGLWGLDLLDVVDLEFDK